LKEIYLHKKNEDKFLTIEHLFVSHSVAE